MSGAKDVRTSLVLHTELVDAPTTEFRQHCLALFTHPQLDVCKVLVHITPLCGVAFGPGLLRTEHVAIRAAYNLHTTLLNEHSKIMAASPWVAQSSQKSGQVWSMSGQSQPMLVELCQKLGPSVVAKSGRLRAKFGRVKASPRPTVAQSRRTWLPTHALYTRAGANSGPCAESRGRISFRNAD